MGVASVLGALCFVFLFWWPWSDPGPRPPGPESGDNGMETSFGRIESEWHRSFRFHPVEWEARVTLQPNATPDAAMYMFAFVSESPTARVNFSELSTSSGGPVVIEQDQRASEPLVPKVFVNASDLPPAGETLILRGDVTLDNNGRYQVGALVIAFDAAWAKVYTPAGDMAQLYGYGFVGATNVDASATAPPFEGKGNVASAGGLFMTAAIAAGGLAGLLYVWREGAPLKVPPAPARPKSTPPLAKPAAPAARPRPRPVGPTRAASPPATARPKTAPPIRRTDATVRPTGVRRPVAPPVIPPGKIRRS